MQLLEISDLVVSHDPVTRERLPVRRDAVVARLAAAGDRHGARIAATLPCDGDGVLDPVATDRRLVAVHTELQRLNEELRIGDRITELLRPVLAAIRAAEPGRPLRVVDIGCGLGYLIRRLAASGPLLAPGTSAAPGTPTAPGGGPGVELVGVDHHAALVAEADRLARAEHLPCRFVRGDAFRLDQPATVYISSGVLHHFRGPDLDTFFAAQSVTGSGAAAFCHFDIAATGLAPVGAWIFHRARMRDPLGRHDGVVSALRAHDDGTLLRAAAHAEGMVPLVYEPRARSNPFCTTIRPVLGIRPDLLPALRTALGRRPSNRLATPDTLPPRPRPPWNPWLPGTPRRRAATEPVERSAVPEAAVPEPVVPGPGGDGGRPAPVGPGVQEPAVVRRPPGATGAGRARSAPPLTADGPKPAVPGTGRAGESRTAPEPGVRSGTPRSSAAPAATEPRSAPRPLGAAPGSVPAHGTAAPEPAVPDREPPGVPGRVPRGRSPR
ncbi:class I SAM-dependent methyltransferase [Streptomyces yaizuensis]|uniref:Class I SAM-dependent methyltransferase n=1 Tax=Streptomyces yaizuensis TaxID=2989713 RepID=A0ABQ5NUJ7_9ACTN|nr:hypothetical protein [Streptomyces sp. YSPA8]GLF94038.1 hypothetical protein SYYSPA8_07095 [Streptomyces sp. YSPA8]